MKYFKSLLFVLFVSVTMTCEAQALETNDHLALYGLKGAVAEIKETHFDGPYIEVYRFDTLGRLTHYHMLANAGMAKEENMDFWETMWAYDYWYDNNGQIQGDEEDIENFPMPSEDYGDPEIYTVKRNRHGDIVGFEAKRFPDLKATITVNYDSHGNWVGKAEVWLNEFDVDVKNIVTREIKYY